jgi:hypothetical protein
MSLAATLPTAILDTILGRLALLFLTGADGDRAAARDAARKMLAAYHPETENELRLAAEIVSFSFHALEALSQAATPDMPLTRILRLRGSAVSLSRESHKSQRKLDQLQKDRRAGLQPQPAATAAPQPAATAAPHPAAAEPARPQVDKAIALIEATRHAIATGAKDGKAWGSFDNRAFDNRAFDKRAFDKSDAARRITENLRNNSAAHAAAQAAAQFTAPTA